LGSGEEEEGLQHRQSKHQTTTRLDNSTRRRSHTWWIRLRLLCACVPPDNPEGPMARLLPTPQMIQGSCSCLPSLQLPSPLGGSRAALLACTRGLQRRGGEIRLAWGLSKEVKAEHGSDWGLGNYSAD
jgi:hypothetical protein